MDCSYFAAGVCRSCTFLQTPYGEQLARKQTRVADALAAFPGLAWAPALASREEGFRNKAKMVVAGTAASPALGILSPDGLGVDLRECGLHSAGLYAALPVLASFVSSTGLTPYSVPERRGELKHLLVTESPDGELMVRFVLRSRALLGRLSAALPGLVSALPIAVASVNLQPDHKAILEGPAEILLAGDTLRMRVNDIDLHLRPQSFFQTNTEVAAALYREARAIVEAVDPGSVWDLYCGVGGFGLHVAAPGRSVVGVEVSEQAIASAELSTAELGAEARWVAGDATGYALASADVPELAIVNPPRRGIGAELAGWLEASGVPQLVYSSCNVDSLARDLALMPSLTPVSARLLDMFPHTDHHELLVHLAR